MATALGFVVFGVGVGLIYVGYRGLSVQEFWGMLLSGAPSTPLTPAQAGQAKAASTAVGKATSNVQSALGGL